MPTLKGPIKFGGGCSIPPEMLGVMKLPFQADNARFTAKPDEVKVEPTGFSNAPKPAEAKAEPTPKAVPKAAIKPKKGGK